jgi:hypothetical protein
MLSLRRGAGQLPEAQLDATIDEIGHRGDLWRWRGVVVAPGCRELRSDLLIEAPRGFTDRV